MNRVKRHDRKRSVWDTKRHHATPCTAAGKAIAEAAEAFAASVVPLIRELRGQGLSLGRIAAALTAQGVKTQRGGAWTPTGVKNIIARV